MNATNAVRESMIRYVANREWIRRTEFGGGYIWWVGVYNKPAPFPNRLLGRFANGFWVPMISEYTADVPAPDPDNKLGLLEYCSENYPHIMAVVRSLSDTELVEAIECYAKDYDRSPLDTSRKVEL